MRRGIHRLSLLSASALILIAGQAGAQTKPADFDPTKKYPLLVYVYGEPAGQTVQDSWGGNTYLWHLMLAQQGYIVASFDNRGTPAGAR